MVEILLVLQITIIIVVWKHLLKIEYLYAAGYKVY